MASAGIRESTVWVHDSRSQFQATIVASCFRLPRQCPRELKIGQRADGLVRRHSAMDADQFSTVDHLMLWDVDKGTTLANFLKRGSTILGGDRYRFAAVSDNQLGVWSLR